MDRISDRALDFGAYELDNELETGLELSQRLLVEVAARQFRAAEIHHEALLACEVKAKDPIVPSLTGIASTSAR